MASPSFSAPVANSYQVPVHSKTHLHPPTTIAHISPYDSGMIEADPTILLSPAFGAPPFSNVTHPSSYAPYQQTYQQHTSYPHHAHYPSAPASDFDASMLPSQESALFSQQLGYNGGEFMAQMPTDQVDWTGGQDGVDPQHYMNPNDVQGWYLGHNVEPSLHIAPSSTVPSSIPSTSQSMIFNEAGFPSYYPYSEPNHEPNFEPVHPLESSTAASELRETYLLLAPPRLRTQQACERCRKRKVKCTGDRPSCQRCSSRGQTCEYAPPPLDRKTKALEKARAERRSRELDPRLQFTPYQRAVMERLARHQNQVNGPLLYVGGGEYQDMPIRSGSDMQGHLLGGNTNTAHPQARSLSHDPRVNHHGYSATPPHVRRASTHPHSRSNSYSPNHPRPGVTRPPQLHLGSLPPPPDFSRMAMNAHISPRSSKIGQYPPSMNVPSSTASQPVGSHHHDPYTISLPATPSRSSSGNGSQVQASSTEHQSQPSALSRTSSGQEHGTEMRNVEEMSMMVNPGASSGFSSMSSSSLSSSLPFSDLNEYTSPSSSGSSSEPSTPDEEIDNQAVQARAPMIDNAYATDTSAYLVEAKEIPVIEDLSRDDSIISETSTLTELEELFKMVGEVPAAKLDEMMLEEMFEFGIEYEY